MSSDLINEMSDVRKNRYPSLVGKHNFSGVFNVKGYFRQKLRVPIFLVNLIYVSCCTAPFSFQSNDKSILIYLA